MVALEVVGVVTDKGWLDSGSINPTGNGIIAHALTHLILMAISSTKITSALSSTIVAVLRVISILTVPIQGCTNVFIWSI